jgi:hypothetical protein
MKRFHLNQPTMRILIALIVVGGFAISLYWMGRLPAPSEANRVRVEKDIFSIIKPPGWDEKTIYGSDGIVSVKLDPPKSVGRSEMIYAARILPPTTQKLAPMSEEEFQGQKAWIEYKTLKWEYLWHTIFQRGPYWYEIELHLQLKEDVPNSEWWPYLMSFRAGNGPTTRPVLILPRVSPVATTIPGGFGNAP